jgi:hypothetical protein
MMLKKIKDGIKKMMSKVKSTINQGTSRETAQNLAARKKTSVPPAKEVLGSHVTEIEKTKFSHPEFHRPPRQMAQELPGGYGQDKIVLQARDPWWLHTYWEVTGRTWDSLRHKLGDLFSSSKRTLRVYDVSFINFNGKNANRYFDIEVGPDVNNWYIDTGSPGRFWCVDYGLKLINGDFITIIRSNIVQAPLDGPSWITDEEWMIPDDMFGRLYGLGFGFGRSSPVGKAWQQRYKALFSGALSSPGIASAASPVKKPKEKKFWLTADCELIVYGATLPDATLTVQGKRINLRPDGSFTLRFCLPDGKQVIPIKAVSAEKEEERTITPTVIRETKSSEILKEATV